MSEGEKGRRQMAEGLLEGWQSKALGELLTGIQGGFSVNASDSPANEGQAGILKLSSVLDGFFRPEHNKAVADEDLEQLSVYPKADSVIISRANTKELVGMCGYVPQNFPTLFLPDLLWQLQGNTEQVSMKWLSYWLSSPQGRDKVTSLAAGSNASMVKINKESFKKLSLLLPPLPEQRKIAAILSTWDDSIATLTNLLAAKRQQKRGLAEALLTGKKRLPGFEGEWENHPLGLLMPQKPKETAGETEYPILSVTVEGIKPQGDHFNKRVASEKTSDYLVVRRGEIAMSGLNFWMGAIDMQTIEDAGIISPAYKVFRVNPGKLDSELARHFIKSERMRQILLDSSIQGASIVRRNLDMQSLKESEVRMPSLPEQKAIASILSTLDSEIASLEALKAKVQEQKRGLMDELLTGRVRVAR